MPYLGSAELAGHAMWDRLRSAKSESEARLCKAALGNLADAEIQRAFTEDVKRAVSPPTRSRSRWPNNTIGRRHEARRAARAPAPEQGVPNVHEEAAVEVAENVREEAAVEAGAEEAHEHVDELNHDEESMAAEQVIVDTQDNDRDLEEEIGESTTDEVARPQQGGEQAVSGAETTRAGVDDQVELPAAVAVAVTVEREQFELPDDEKGVGGNAELSLVQQPAELEEAVGEARMVKSRQDEEDMSALEVAHHSFCFSPSKRDRKLSDEEQQEEAKRPKSPEREGVQLAEQRGSGGEGGEEMGIEMPQFMDRTEEQIIQWADAMWDESKRKLKLLDEEQQEEAKRPKPPEREGVQLAEQHGSGGEGGEQMETDMREIPLGVGFGFGSGSTRPYVFRPLGSAPAPTAL